MSPVIIVIICVVIGTLVVLAVTRVVKRANRTMHSARLETVRARSRADAAEKAATLANDQHQQAAKVVVEAVAQTGQALAVAREIKKVSAQMDTLLGFVANEADELPRGRHAVPKPERQALT